jgi:hypothetical protein
MLVPKATTVPASFVALMLLACGATAQRSSRPKATTGSIGGLARDQNSGEAVARASLELSSGARATSGPAGLFTIDDIKPGRYELVAKYAGQTVTTKNIVIDAGEVSYVDVNFTLGNPEPLVFDYADPALYEVRHYRTKGNSTVIEGSVNQAQTRQRVAGAVVTAFRGPEVETLQTVTDDQGRYRFEAVEPGTYIVSAYYNIGGRGQIEVRRSNIEVERGDGVIVPLWVELTKQ